jgi:hypothetical protein
MLPVRPLRAALLAFIGALALVEAGAGLIVGQAWRLHEGDALSATERSDLAQMLERLRVMENVVVAGALATTLLWSLVAIANATFGARGGLRNGAFAAAGCVASPILFLAFRAGEADGGSGRLVVVGAQALALYLPFWALGRVAVGVGGRSIPFMRWYLALAASFVVHDLFTTSLDLANPQQADDFGRTSMMFLVNALVVAVMGVMAAEATRAMDRATSERALTHRLLHDDANRRERPGAIAFDPGSGAQTTLPSLPPPSTTLSLAPATSSAVTPVLAATSVATLTPPHPQSAVGAPMPPPIVPVAFPTPPPVVEGSPLDVVPIVITPATEPAVVDVPSPVEQPVEQATMSVPPVAIPALQPLASMHEPRPMTPISVPVVPMTVPMTAPDPAGPVNDVVPASAPEPEATAESPLDAPATGLPSMFQPLTRRGA